MNTKEIKPKTLVAVLSAAIKEDAESIAQKIVENAKNDNVEYASLVETFILNKRDKENITFSLFAENAFEQIKDIKKLRSFSVGLRCRWRKKGDPEQFIYEEKNDFFIEGDLDIVAENSWDKSVRAYGNNAYSVFEEFKEGVDKKITAVIPTPTEVYLPEDSQS